MKKYIYEQGLPFDETEAKVGFSLKKKLYSGRSKFQKIEVFELGFLGKTLYLDGILQTCEKDEFIYHEMIVHLPMFSHPNPEKVLIIGGGDGGSLRETLKHKSVKEAWMAELDEKVIGISEKYIPGISNGSFGDKRAKVLIADGREIIKKNPGYFDVIILDLPDPSENSKHLISTAFYKEVKEAMAGKGVVSVQSGSFTNQPKLVALIKKRMKSVFKFVQPNRMCIPSYQAGEFSLTVASDIDIFKSDKKNLERKSRNFKLKYWSPDMHMVSHILPKYISDQL